MRHVSEIRFIYMFRDDVSLNPAGEYTFINRNASPLMEVTIMDEPNFVRSHNQELDEAFKIVEGVLEEFGITSKNANFQRDTDELVVSTDFEFNTSLIVLSKLEELFDVTFFEIDTDYDDFYDVNPHISYAFYRK